MWGVGCASKYPAIMPPQCSGSWRWRMVRLSCALFDMLICFYFAPEVSIEYKDLSAQFRYIMDTKESMDQCKEHNHNHDDRAKLGHLLISPPPALPASPPAISSSHHPWLTLSTSTLPTPSLFSNAFHEKNYSELPKPVHGNRWAGNPSALPRLYQCYLTGFELRSHICDH